jgi:hypothetical protein
LAEFVVIPVDQTLDEAANSVFVLLLVIRLRQIDVLVSINLSVAKIQIILFDAYLITTVSNKLSVALGACVVQGLTEFIRSVSTFAIPIVA